MSVTSGGKALEVVAANPPGRVEVGGGCNRVECAAIDVAENGRGGICLASEAGVAEGQCLEAGAAAVTGVDIAHGRTVVEGVAAGGNAKRHGDVDCPLDGSAVVVAQLGECEGGSQRPVSAMRMDGEGALSRPPQTGTGFVSKNGGFQQPRTGQVVCFGFGQSRRDDLDCRVGARAEIALVEIMPRAGRAV